MPSPTAPPMGGIPGVAVPHRQSRRVRQGHERTVWVCLRWPPVLVCTSPPPETSRRPPVVINSFVPRRRRVSHPWIHSTDGNGELTPSTAGSGHGGIRAGTARRQRNSRSRRFRPGPKSGIRSRWHGRRRGGRVQGPDDDAAGRVPMARRDRPRSRRLRPRPCPGPQRGPCRPLVGRTFASSATDGKARRERRGRTTTAETLPSQSAPGVKAP